MLPTFRDRGFNFISRNSFRNHEPRRGDVVAIRFAGVKAMLLKRVVALPGETIAFHHGLLVVDGKYIPEPYVLLPCDWEIAPETVAAGEYFVVGDNRSMPERFHTKGRAPRERIVGKPIL